MFTTVTRLGKMPDLVFYSCFCVGFTTKTHKEDSTCVYMQYIMCVCTVYNLGMSKTSRLVD